MQEEGGEVNLSWRLSGCITALLSHSPFVEAFFKINYVPLARYAAVIMDIFSHCEINKTFASR